MARRKADKLPAELKQAAARWAQWRSTRERGARIPEALWRSAVGLAARYGVSKTATMLKLGYYELKKRLDAEAPRRRQHGQADAAQAFVELAPPTSATPGRCVIECQKASGASMRIELCGALPDLAALSRSFWETR
jgi:hypothetical protein